MDIDAWKFTLREAPRRCALMLACRLGAGHWLGILSQGGWNANQIDSLTMS
jgi:hypothetical protein